MQDFRELPAHPMNEDDQEQWRSWAREAPASELLEAFLCRLNLNRSTLPDLEPVQALLVDRLREQLAPVQADQESEAA